MRCAAVWLFALLPFAVFSAPALQPGGFLLTLNGTADKTKLTASTGSISIVPAGEGKGSGKFFRLGVEFAPESTWKKVEFSFESARDAKLVLAFYAPEGAPLLFDDLTLDGELLPNGSFEIADDTYRGGMRYCWSYREQPLTGSAGRTGKQSLRVSPGDEVCFAFRVLPKRKYTLAVWVRKAEK